MRIYTICLVPLLLAGCASLPESVTHDKYFIEDDYRASIWFSDKFEGTHARRLDNGILTFELDQTAERGGTDFGLSRTKTWFRPVRDLPDRMTVYSSYDIDLPGEGRWWAGPKVSVNWQGMEEAKGNGDDWYENYVVEIASSTPQELHDIYTGDFFKAEVLPDTMQDGSTYKHYKIRFEQWWQFWSVRQDYRESGKLDLKAIVDVWSEYGLPQGRRFDGVKANIETYGRVSGTGVMRFDFGPDCNL